LFVGVLLFVGSGESREVRFPRDLFVEKGREEEKRKGGEREVPTGRGVERMISEEVKGETGWSKGSMMNEGMWCL
jgi:hypothetical protein